MNKNDKNRFSLKKIYYVYWITFLVVSVSFIIFDINKYIIIFVYFFMVLCFLSCIRKKIIEFVDIIEEILEQIMVDGKILDIKDSLENDDLFSRIIHSLRKLCNMYYAKENILREEKGKIESMVSDIAHQIKTPITNIKMYLDILLKKIDHSEDTLRTSNIILSQVNKLEFLIQSMLKLSELETGIIELNTEETIVQTSIGRALESILLLAQKKNIGVNVFGDLKTQIYCDNKWTTEALFNILDNAVKYTNENGIIDIRVDRSGIYTCICISDNGIGISKENKPKIFQRFFRIKDTGYMDGVGIGLSLAREIVMKQRGYISVKSEKGIGSEFSVFLPESRLAMGDKNEKM